MNKNKNYEPLLFLSSLGPGGMSVVFFMYLMYMIPRDTKTSPIPTFNTLSDIFMNADSSIFFKGLIIFGITGILYFAFKHIQLLIWNIKEYKIFKKTEKYKELKTGNGEVTLLAEPLTYAMTINVSFILGAILIPNLWNIVEYLFPLALIGFCLVGLLALKLFSEYFIRLITQKGNTDIVENNNLGQLLSSFAFVMVGVGFAASSAMSKEIITSSIGLIFSTFFIILALGVLVLKLIVGFKAILKKGLDESASPTLWIVIPILTLVGITIVRNMHGLHSNFESHFSNGAYLMLTLIIISIQLIFGYLGMKVMNKNKYFEEYIHGKKKSAGTFSLVCPGVALIVFGFFFLHLGLVRGGIVDKFSIGYFILLLPLIYLQFITIKTMLILNKKFEL